MAKHFIESTRVKIIKAATELIFKQGLYGITYGQIAAKAKLTHPAIYKHFKDMDELIYQACKHWLAEAHDVLKIKESELDSASNQLRKYIEGNLLYTFNNQKKDALMLGLYYNALHSSQLMDFYKEMKGDTLHRIEVLLVRGNFERSWKVKQPKALAYSIHSILVGEIIKLIIEPKEFEIKNRTDRLYNDVLKLILSAKS